MQTTIRILAILALSLAALAAACGGEADDGAAPPASPARQPPERPDREPLIEGQTTAEGYKAILGTGDLGVGAQRVGFVLTSSTGFVNAEGVRVTPIRTGGDGAPAPRPAVATRFYEWPYGNRGLYAAIVEFDEPGQWELDISLPLAGGGEASVPLAFEVFERAHSPMQGDAAPRTKTRTLNDVESLDELTTGSLRDPDLYRISLDEAIANGKPTVVVFASPAFCQNAVCGPQVDVLQELKDVYAGSANFVHVDFYDNPHEIQGDLGRAVISPAVREWGLPSIEWTFIIDGGGVVRARFEGFATYDEVEDALRGEL